MVDVDMKKVGLAMQRAREFRGLTQRQLADEADVAKATIAGWEQGEGAHLYLAMIAAKTLNLTISQYIGEEPLE